MVDFDSLIKASNEKLGTFIDSTTKTVFESVIDRLVIPSIDVCLMTGTNLIKLEQQDISSIISNAFNQQGDLVGITSYEPFKLDKIKSAVTEHCQSELAKNLKSLGFKATISGYTKTI